MTTIDYTALGKNKKTADRRYKVLRLTMKGLTPIEILRSINTLGGVYAKVSYKTIQRDVCHLQTTQLNTLPLDIIKDMGQSFFELRIREYETELKTTKNDGARAKLHELIHKAKIESLKISGAYVEKVEHSGNVGVSIVDDVPKPHKTQDAD